jgi:hypothetical protein
MAEAPLSEFGQGCFRTFSAGSHPTSAFLLANVVGSGITSERLAGGNVAIALLPNTLATGAGLVALIATFTVSRARTSTHW